MRSHRGVTGERAVLFIFAHTPGYHKIVYTVHLLLNAYQTRQLNAVFTNPPIQVFFQEVHRVRSAPIDGDPRELSLFLNAQKRDADPPVTFSA